MEKPTTPRSTVLALLAAAVLCVSPVRQGGAQGEVPFLAVAEIHYVDTSGEVIDQSADHQRRLRTFEASLRRDLAAGGKLRSVVLDCPSNACSVGDIDADQLIGKAQAAGADFLLISSFHKMSTLVQWAKFDMIDVKAQKLIFGSHGLLPWRQRRGLAARGNPSWCATSWIANSVATPARQQPLLDRLDLQRQLF